MNSLRALQTNPVTTLETIIRGNVTWQVRLRKASEAGFSIGLHLAIFNEPFLTYLMEGRKTVESRFSQKRIAPYEQVGPGDIILVKRSAGPVVAICEAASVWYYKVDSDSLREIRSKFGSAICATGEEFWHTRASTAYATLITLRNVTPVAPFHILKQDRRGWVAIKETNVNAVAIALAGRIGSGKTGLATRLASYLGALHLSFGNYFRALALRNGLPQHRQALQDLGAIYVGQNPQRVVDELLAEGQWEPGSSVVVDGVRHVEVLRALRAAVAPMPLFLVFLERHEKPLPPSKYDGADTTAILQMEGHSTETNVDSLRSLADLVIPPASDGNEALESILSAAQERTRRQ